MVMVYNAEEGLFNAVSDSIHKVFSPSTYECRLCLFTYGVAGMLKKWKEFLESIPLEKTFYHRKAFAQAYPEANSKLPAIFIDSDDELTLIVSAEEMDGIEDLDELVDLLADRLKDRGLLKENKKQGATQ